MSNLLLSILEVWLPAKWPKLIMGSSISLSLGTLIPLEWLQIVGLHLSQEEMSSIRITGIPWLLLFALATSHVLILNDIRKARTSRHLVEIERLFRNALSIISDRSRLTLNAINDFKATFDANKIYLRRNQEKFLAGLLSDSQDLRIFAEERMGTLTDENRSRIVAEERKLLNRIEDSKITIEGFLRELA